MWVLANVHNSAIILICLFVCGFVWYLLYKSWAHTLFRAWNSPTTAQNNSFHAVGMIYTRRPSFILVCRMTSGREKKCCSTKVHLLIECQLSSSISLVTNFLHQQNVEHVLCIIDWINFTQSVSNWSVNEYICSARRLYFHKRMNGRQYASLSLDCGIQIEFAFKINANNKMRTDFITLMKVKTSFPNFIKLSIHPTLPPLSMHFFVCWKVKMILGNRSTNFKLHS